MSFRVTQGILSRNMMHNLNHNLLRMQQYQEYMTTQSRINRPSDDPVGFNYVMRFRSELRSNEQYQKNRDLALSWLEATENLINSVNDIIQRAQELAIQGANGSNSDASRESIATEVDELLEHLVTIGNEKFNGKYVFNGERTQTPPYEVDVSEVDGEKNVIGDVHDGKIVLQIGPGVELEMNVTGDEVFGKIGDGEDNLFQILKDLSTALHSEETGDFDDIIERLDGHSDQLLKTLAGIGARTRRIELTTVRLHDDNHNLNKMLAQTEGIDLAEVITHMKMAENVYIASLSVGARLIQPSLIDFLR